MSEEIKIGDIVTPASKEGRFKVVDIRDRYVYIRRIKANGDFDRRAYKWDEMHRKDRVRLCK